MGQVGEKLLLGAALQYHSFMTFLPSAKPAGELQVVTQSTTPIDSRLGRKEKGSNFSWDNLLFNQGTNSIKKYESFPTYHC